MSNPSAVSAVSASGSSKTHSSAPLDAMLASLKAAVRSGSFDQADVWASQAVEAVRGDDDRNHRAQVNTAVTSLLVASSLHARRAIITAGGLFGRLSAPVGVMVKCSDLLCEIARMADRGVALGTALVIQGHAKQLQSAVAEHSGTSYRYTKGDELKAALNALDEIVLASDRLSCEETPVPTSLRDQKLAVTAIDNAKSCLSRVCPKRWSDWTKAQVLIEEARSLLADREGQFKSIFDGAAAALLSQDYKHSSEALSQLSSALAATR